MTREEIIEAIIEEWEVMEGEMYPEDINFSVMRELMNKLKEEHMPLKSPIEVAADKLIYRANEQRTKLVAGLSDDLRALAEALRQIQREQNALSASVLRLVERG